MKNGRWIQCDSHEIFIDVAVGFLVNILKHKPETLFTLATGHSPSDVYARWADAIKHEQIDTSRMRVHQLDEWVGVPGFHESSCQQFLRSHVVAPLGIDEDRFLSIDGDACDPKVEASRVGRLLSKNRFADVTVLGVGKNGHVGLNEPGSVWYPMTHVATLADSSKHHAMLSDSDYVVEQGITTGMAEIIASDTLLVLVSGPGKDVTRLADPRIATDFPASCIHLHPRVTVVLDYPYQCG